MSDCFHLDDFPTMLIPTSTEMAGLGSILSKRMRVESLKLYLPCPISSPLASRRLSVLFLLNSPDIASSCRLNMVDVIDVHHITDNMGGLYTAVKPYPCGTQFNVLRVLLVLWR